MKIFASLSLVSEYFMEVERLRNDLESSLPDELNEGLKTLRSLFGASK